ncbi:putative helicase mug81 [Smittium mucronatum]|uniref:U5 small nuclear ribonucleoprotein 200 kDa helicase n=1 Tax=Smittium mucronatum TaxID=133383 RepID=A0A1R0GXN0_9FUNG|nr:putative helicase mug81 [Smittium mucronatum]
MKRFFDLPHENDDSETVEIDSKFTHFPKDILKLDDFEELIKPKLEESIAGPSESSNYSALWLLNKKPGSSATIFSKKELNYIKHSKKKAPFNKKKLSDSISESSKFGSGFKEKRIRDLTKGPHKELLKSSEPKLTYRHVYTNETTGKFLSEYGNRLTLPIGSTTENFGYYKEVTIPRAYNSKKKHFDLVNIDEMDFLCKGTFKGYKTLNTIQSVIYPTVYKTNENILVCAPTGAGKTEIGMLAILRLIYNYSNISSDLESVLDETKHQPEESLNKSIIINKSDFKAVYVAPMKALASEIVRKYSEKLKWLGIKVQELTGDTQLTRKEIKAANIIVTTPEKWDVITRKSVSNSAELIGLVRLLIIDEVHLLQDDRGPVLESIVARTNRHVESYQSMIRIVGLSATLPNYIDVAEFLSVNLQSGMFYFGSEYRPVPLEQHFIGINNKSSIKGVSSSNFTSNTYLDNVTYEKIESILKDNPDRQVMVFVHTRKDTVKSAMDVNLKATGYNQLDLFQCRDSGNFAKYYSQLSNKSKNKELIELVGSGFGVHHAGMLRSDRRIVETMFELGLIKVLFSTSTLAWGVNLPAAAVIIKGTQVYSLQKGGYSDLSVLDIVQIFGRAGRPQFIGDYGIGYLITEHDKVDDYIRLISLQKPIESRAQKYLVDMLNAEIVLGSISSIDEAVSWLGYTFMFVRMRKNPIAYGVNDIPESTSDDPFLINFRRNLLSLVASKLNQLQMVVFDPVSGQILSKELGRIASTFYLSSLTIERFNSLLKPSMTIADLISIISLSNEFDQISVRESESKDLISLLKNSTCCDIKGIPTFVTTSGGGSKKNGLDSQVDATKFTSETKTNIIIQSIISRSAITDFGLTSDANYIGQNATRIVRALFEIAISRNYCDTAMSLLSLCISIERRIWQFEHPLVQFDLPISIIKKITEVSDSGSSVYNSTTIHQLRTFEPKELGQLVNNNRFGPIIYHYLSVFPLLDLSSYKVTPITEKILRIDLELIADFDWEDKFHGGVDSGIEKFYLFLEDPENGSIIYNDSCLIGKSQLNVNIGFTIPMPAKEIHKKNELVLHILSSSWHGSDSSFPIKVDKLKMPINPEIIETKLLNLVPLPISALQNPKAISMYQSKFSYFNPIQTQIFDSLYNTQQNVLLGAPTGSGKTLAAEIAMLSAFKKFPGKKCVYIAPLKALVKERVKDWGPRFKKYLGYNLVELSGDVAPDFSLIEKSDIIVTTPEKWDGISRRYKQVDYVKNISLIIFDEIHLLGSDRGPILEAIVSRMNMIGSSLNSGNPLTRLIGLSTAMANASELANWLDVKPSGLFNFSMAIRLVPLSIYIEKFSNKHYSPRMSSMNRPAFRSIKKLSPDKPVIIFVSSRRQTRLTATEIIGFLGNESNPKQFLKMTNIELEILLENVLDPDLAFCLAFGIGIHHAGLTDSDRTITEKLFAERKIQVLVATSTLAWGVNLPAHLVIVKGTEFFDAKTHGYLDMPMTDVLQMVGRAGRPQFDTSAIAVVYVYEPKFYYYKNFLFSKFPVESNMHRYLVDHLNAEINGTNLIQSAQDAVNYLTKTFLINRLRSNPNYYGVNDSNNHELNLYLSDLVMDSFNQLELSNCISFISGSPGGDGDIIQLDETQFPELNSSKILDEEKNNNSEVSNALQIEKLSSDKTSLKKSSSKGDILIYPTTSGRICSTYYLSHLTMRILDDKMLLIDKNSKNSFFQMFSLLCDVHEWSELAVRHNEDILNRQLDQQVKYSLMSRDGNQTDFGDPKVKTNILLQFHLSRISLPISDYKTDLRTVLDSSIRIMQAMIDFASSELKNLYSLLLITNLLQCIKQACWPTDSPILMFVDKSDINIKTTKLVEMAKLYYKTMGTGDLKTARIPDTTFDLDFLDAKHDETDVIDKNQTLEEFCDSNNLNFNSILYGISQLPIYKAKIENISIVGEFCQVLIKISTPFVYSNMINTKNSASKNGVSNTGQLKCKKKTIGEAYTPRFGKLQLEGNFLVIGNKSNNTVLKFMRFGALRTDSRTVRVKFKLPPLGKHKLTLFVISDAYLGLDYQKDFSIDVV